MMIKQMKKISILSLVFCVILMMFTTVFAASDENSNYEAKITNNNTEYFFSTLEEAFSSSILQSGSNSVIKLLKDSEVEETLVADAKTNNLQIDLNGCSITSSADPVIQTGTMTFITNSTEEACFIIQKNVLTESSVSPNTIIYAPSSAFVLNINAKNLTIGDKTGTAVNCQAKLPSIQNGIFLGQLFISKPLFGTAITGGYFSQDPTEYIDTNAYLAVKGENDLYYLKEYHAATVDAVSGNVIQKYALVQQAVDASEFDGMIKLLKQGSPPKTLNIVSDDKITLDLAGFQFIGAASPLAGNRVDGTSLIKNQGTLSIVDSDKADPGALNFVYAEDFYGDCFCTILNQGILKLNDIRVSVNYNQPNYPGNIYTLCNDSSNSDAIIYIDSKSQVGGLKLEPEDPATGKYPAINTKGNGKYTNAVHIEYVDSNDNTDIVTFLVENVTIGEIMSVFDAEENYTTTLSLNNGTKLQKRNIILKKDGVKTDNFEYDANTDILTIPSSLFTEDIDSIEISLGYQVKFMVDDEVFKTMIVEYGKDAIMPELPEKEGYTAKWDSDGKNITKDTIITAVYTPIINNPATGDNITVYVVTFLMSLIGFITITIILERKKVIKH